MDTGEWRGRDGQREGERGRERVREGERGREREREGERGEGDEMRGRVRGAAVWTSPRF